MKDDIKMWVSVTICTIIMLIIFTIMIEMAIGRQVCMEILFKCEEAFEKVKKYLERNQYSFEFWQSENKEYFFIKVTEWG